MLDLGSGGGKICYIAAQIVGAAGKVIGVDANEEMLALAEKHRAEIGDEIGYQNVEFRRGNIQDLRLDLALVDSYLRENPIKSAADLAEFDIFRERIKTEKPLVESDSIDVVLSNCVLNLVKTEDKERLFDEIFRVVKTGGRAAISDIVADEEVPAHLQKDAALWSGCISGAFREDRFLEAFERAGFYGMEIVKRDEKPWRTIEGIEFRAVTIVARKGKQGACFERNQAVIYKGPWKKVTDDDGHILERGARTAVCDKTFQIYSRDPYAKDIIAIEPIAAIALEDAEEFDCHRAARRSPRETKGLEYNLNDLTGADCCAPGSDCC